MSDSDVAVEEIARLVDHARCKVTKWSTATRPGLS